MNKLILGGCLLAEEHLTTKPICVSTINVLFTVEDNGTTYTFYRGGVVVVSYIQNTTTWVKYLRV